MSLINQVLNQLEERGVQASPNQTMLRAVPARREKKWLKPVFIILAAIIVLALTKLLWSKIQPHSIKSEKAEVIANVIPTPIPVEQPIKKKAQTAAAKKSPAISTAVHTESSRESHPVKADVAVEKPATAIEQEPKMVSATNSQVEHKQPESKARVLGGIPSGQAHLKQVSSTQQADAEYRKSWELQQQGHVAEALEGYEATLKLNALHDDARLAMAVLLVENKRSEDAERVMQEGVKLKPTHTGFRMVLARVQVERVENAQALATLQEGLAQATGKADYHAFYAALLQREGKNKEAVEHFQVAVQISPNNGIWQMGYGISLQAVERSEEAKAAYQQALATKTLNPGLTEFIQQKLKGL
jgi:MSHA biogenesis protein MshN